MGAAEAGFISVVELLEEEQTQQTLNGQTALMYAARAGKIESCKLLLKEVSLVNN